MRPVRKTQSATSPSSRSGIASVSKPILSAELERSKSAPRYGSQVSLSTGRDAPQPYRATVWCSISSSSSSNPKPGRSGSARQPSGSIHGLEVSI